MDLKKRLAQLDRLTRRPEAPTAPTSRLSVSPSDLGLVEGPDGLWSMRCRTTVPGASGDLIPDLRGLIPDHWDHPRRMADLLLLDTETTGLMGGTGTVAFLVGLAWFDGDDLCIEQHLLPTPSREGALLDVVAAAGQGRRTLVSYNGATFDWPLLRSRALLNRRNDPLAGLEGFDLLVPARRLWGRALPDCRQQSVEREVCGRARGGGDIPGDEIPQAWFDFLAGRGGQDLQRVLTHNRRDMEGMAQILLAVTALAAAMAGRPAPGAVQGQVAWSLGRACERRRETREAAAWLRLALAAEGEAPDLRLVADAVRLLKRAGDWQGALDVIDGAAEAGRANEALHREAAIIWEHRLGDPHKALAHARRTGDHHRVARLRRRAGIADPQEDAR